MGGKSICLTFDVEEYSIANEYCKNSKYANSTEFSSKGVMRLLKLLDKYGIKSTFFVTGFFAEKEPKIVKEIFKRGHEIASHSYKDENHSGFSRKKTFESIEASKKVIEKIIGGNVKGFRMPGFSVNKHLFGVLKKLGFEYDSSIHPAIVPGHYYNFFEKRDISDVVKGLKEVPISVIPFLRLPISWVWMRNLGNWVTDFGVGINLLENKNVILYFHPWEFTELPNINGIPKYITNKCGEKFVVSLEWFIKKFEKEKFCRLIDLI